MQMQIPKLFLFASIGLALAFFAIHQADIPLPPLSALTPFFGAICIFGISLYFVLRGLNSVKQETVDKASLEDQLSELKLEAKKVKSTLSKLNRQLEVVGNAIAVAKTEFGDANSEEISKEDKVWEDVLKNKGIPIVDLEGKKKLDELYNSQIILEEQIREKSEHLAKMKSIINSVEDPTVDSLVKQARNALRGIN